MPDDFITTEPTHNVQIPARHVVAAIGGSRPRYQLFQLRCENQMGMGKRRRRERWNVRYDLFLERQGMGSACAIPSAGFTTRGQAEARLLSWKTNTWTPCGNLPGCKCDTKPCHGHGTLRNITHFPRVCGIWHGCGMTRPTHSAICTRHKGCACWRCPASVGRTKEEGEEAEECKG